MRDPDRPRDSGRTIQRKMVLLGVPESHRPADPDLLWRDAKLYEIRAGTSEIRRMLIGRELFKKRNNVFRISSRSYLVFRPPALELIGATIVAWNFCVHGLGCAKSQSITSGANCEVRFGRWVAPFMVHSSTAPPGGALV